MNLFQNWNRITDVETKPMVISGECRGRDKLGEWD